nr:long-chain-alcohol oxidase FAO2 [Tanacetum cinerariifolium]
SERRNRPGKPRAPRRNLPQPDTSRSEKPPGRVAAPRRPGRHGYLGRQVIARTSSPRVSRCYDTRRIWQAARPTRQAAVGRELAGAAAAVWAAHARAARAGATELGGLAAVAAAQGISGPAQALHVLVLRQQPGRCGGPPVAATRPIQTLAPVADTSYDCEVLVIGSGAGGGVMAGELAQAGRDVLVLEKGPYFDGTDFTQREADMLSQLYEARGALSTQDGGISLLAGACLGGGTTVNWAGAFRTPDYILEEWAREHDAPHFTSAAFQASLDAVTQALNVNTDYTRHNGQN